jgi:hypothetical protein
MERGGLGLPKVSPGLAMPDPSMPCGRATPEKAISGVARLLGGRPAAVFYPFGHPAPYDHAFQTITINVLVIFTIAVILIP